MIFLLACLCSTAWAVPSCPDSAVTYTALPGQVVADGTVVGTITCTTGEGSPNWSIVDGTDSDWSLAVSGGVVTISRATDVTLGDSVDVHGHFVQYDFPFTINDGDAAVSYYRTIQITPPVRPVFSTNSINPAAVTGFLSGVGGIAVMVAFSIVGIASMVYRRFRVN